MKLYGNLMNRIGEDKQYCPTIEVGTGMTEYGWSDRHAYEVVEVRDQKHVTVRELDHEAKNPGAMDNEWVLISNPDAPLCDMVKVGDYWYWTSTLTAEELAKREDDPRELLALAVGGWDLDKVRAKGKQTKRTRAKVSFGVADYYYDYEF